MLLQLSILSFTLPRAGGSCVRETVARLVASRLLLSQDTPAPWAHYLMAGAIIPSGKTATRLLGVATPMFLMEIYLSSRRLLAGVRYFTLGEIEAELASQLSITTYMLTIFFLSPDCLRYM